MNAKTSWWAILPDLLLVCVVVGLFSLPKKILIILTTKLDIDDKFVSGKMGILKKITLDSPISKITSVKVDQSLIGRVLKYGTLYINTPSGNFEFQCISNPENIKKYILEKM